MPVFGGGGGQTTSARTIWANPAAAVPRSLCQKAQYTYPKGYSTWEPALLNAGALQGQYKADTISGNNGDPVNVWSDCSGRGFDAAASTAPSLATAFLNGLNVVEFNPSVSASYLSLPAGLTTGLAEGSVFFVAKSRIDPPAFSLFTGPVFGEVGTNVNDGAYPWTTGTIFDDFLSTSWQTVGDPGNLAAWHMGSFRSKANDWRYAFNAADFYTTGTNTVGASGGGFIGRNTSGNTFDGHIAEIVFCSSFLNETQRQLIEGYLAWKWGLQALLPVGHTWTASAPPPDAAQSSIIAYSLTAAQGTFSYTGQAALFYAGTDLAAAQGAFTYTGQAAGLTRAFLSPGGQATFTYTGQAANLLRGLVLVAAQGSFSYSGQTATMQPGIGITGALGTFAYTGQAANLLYGRNMAAGQGTFALSGQTSNLTYRAILTAAQGTFSYSGQASNLLRGAILAAANGSYSYSGQAVGFLASMAAGQGSFSLTGQAALLRLGLSLIAGRADFAYYGQPALGTLVRTPFVRHNAPIEALALSLPAPASASIVAAFAPVAPQGSVAAAAISPPAAFSVSPAPPPATLEEA